MTDDVPTLLPVDAPSGIRMVDAAEAPNRPRTAVASGRVLLGPEAFRRVEAGEIQKGDVLTAAQFAGILGAKQTSKLIPLCQDVQLKGVDIELRLDEREHAVDIRAIAKTIGATGVEMEAVTAVSVAALTVYDMCKSVAKGIRVTDIHLLAKTGGQSGDYRKEADESDE